MNCTVRVAKPKALISCVVTIQLILRLCFCIYRQKSGFLLTLLKSAIAKTVLLVIEGLFV